MFVELTGREPVRNAGRAYGARTLCYLDCMRDLDVTIGPGLLDEIAPALQVLFEAGSWYCGRVNEIGQRMIERALPTGGRGPFLPVLMEALRTIMQLPPELADEVAELQRRFAKVLADPDPTAIGERAAAIFSDRVPAWRHAAFHSIDLQIAAHDEADVIAGEWLAVVGDIHLGNNPLMQGVFAHRHPNPPTLLRLQHNAIGSRFPVLVPPFAPGMGVDARGAPLLPDGAIRIAAMPDTRAPGTQRTWLPHELLVDGTDLVDPTGSFRLPLLEVFWLPIYIASARTFDPQPEQDHAPRLAIGHTVLAREAQGQRARNRGSAARTGRRRLRARLLGGIPRAVCSSGEGGSERKPMYLDTDSPVLSSDPLPPRPPRRSRILTAPHPLHRDAPHTAADLAQRRRWQPLRLRAPARRSRHARLRPPSRPAANRRERSLGNKSRSDSGLENAANTPVLTRSRPALRIGPALDTAGLRRLNALEPRLLARLPVRRAASTVQCTTADG